jgi:molybdate transport system substrate-binding protein
MLPLALRALAGALLLAAGAAHAGEVAVAVASNFAEPMKRIAALFTAATGHEVKLSTGSTGKFYSQIVAGAPFEVFLAADDERPRKLVAEGHAVAVSEFTYAIGQLVLWSPKPGVVDGQGAVLAGEGFAKLAIANPRLAPYGAAAVAVLKARGLADKLAPRLVQGDNISQTYQFVATGNAELGFVAGSQVMQPGKAVEGSAWRVPQELYPPIRQDAVLLSKGADNPAAKALLDFLRGPQANEVITGFGYAVAP